VALHFYYLCLCFFPLWLNSPTRTKAASFLRFLDHTKWHTTIGRTFRDDEWLARRKDLYLTHSALKGEISLSPAGFKPAIPSSDGSQTLTLDRSTTGMGICSVICCLILGRTRYFFIEYRQYRRIFLISTLWLHFMELFGDGGNVFISPIVFLMYFYLQILSTKYIV
jgi:hypothetical protein